jgi:4a-hydroxytetrahydrobiopterin dehydratase
MGLREKKCKACTGEESRLPRETVLLLKPEIDPAWKLEGENKKLSRTFQFKDFVTAMKFVNQMADVAESEQHHPDFTVHYNKVDVSVWTHAIPGGGLSENDFILAAKLDPLA